MKTFRAPFAAALTLAGVALAAGSAAAATFKPQDVELCAASFSVLDPEFDSPSGLMTFMNAQNQVRVSSIMPDGTVGPEGCTGTLIDQATWGWPGGVGYNGPEWGRSQRGLEIFYLKQLPDGTTPALAHAWLNGGVWQNEQLAVGDRRATLVPSTDDADLQARLMYLYWPTISQKLQFPFWRESTDPATEQPYAAYFTKSTGSSPRWIPGQRAIALIKPDTAGVLQATRYNIDTKITEFLSSDPGTKSEMWMWSAPEFGGDSVFCVLVDGAALRIYRQIAGVWTVVNNIAANSFSTLTQLYSPEPIVYKGRSYVALQVGNQLKDPNSQIWIVAIDPAAPLARKISNPTVGPVRTEPEWLVTPQGAFIYFTQEYPPKAVGLHRAATGL